jgi:hypothetical protein
LMRIGKLEATKEREDETMTHIRRLPPGSVVTFTNLRRWRTSARMSQNPQPEQETHRRLYRMRFFARPFGVFFFSCLSTFGVCDLTLPARAREPWTGWKVRRAFDERWLCWLLTLSHID